MDVTSPRDDFRHDLRDSGVYLGGERRWDNSHYGDCGEPGWAHGPTYRVGFVSPTGDSTFTWTPSRISSEGFTTTRAPSFNPLVISTSVPKSRPNSSF